MEKICLTKTVWGDEAETSRSFFSFYLQKKPQNKDMRKRKKNTGDSQGNNNSTPLFPQHFSLHNTG